jgi:Subtilase family
MYNVWSSVSARLGWQRSRWLAFCLCVLLGLGFLVVTSHGDVRAASPPAPTKQRLYPNFLPASVAHPGSAIVAFRTPVSAQGNRFGRGRGSGASDEELASINQTLAGLGADSVSQLFTNIPAAKLNAARARAQASTNAYVTDFTQVYEVSYNPAINPGDAANRLASSSLVTSAMPNWRFKVPSDPAPLTPSQVEQALADVAAARAGGSTGIDASGLPTNAAYRTDAQSYHDAASDNVTGAAAMIAGTFGQQPGQGEVVTNVSLGNIDNNSTVLDKGQRYIVQAGYPKIPVWLSSENCVTNAGGTQTCSIVLDPSGTTQDNQGDFLEVNLDFSVMAPPPVGDPRIVNPAPATPTGQLLGEAYGASFRLINPKVNTTPNFVAAFLGAAFLQTPAANVVTASIGVGFSIGGFSDYFFEQEAIIHDAVSLLVNGADIFVSISAGDGQTATQVAMNPNGLTGPTETTNDPKRLTNIADPSLWANPSYSYGLTVEPQFVIDSGANDAGGNTLNDVYNNAPWNTEISEAARHDQHTTETRWTGQQNFHTGNGTRVNVSAPGDDILILAQIEQNGVPVNPAGSFPRLIGGTSASAPEIAGGAAVVRQAARLLGLSLTARQVRDLFVATGRQNVHPAFDLNKDPIGPALDLTAAVQKVFDMARVKGTPSFVRMTVADRKAVLTFSDLRSSFWSDTSQDPVAHTASIDLSQGLVFPSGRTNETVGASGDNVFAPITFGVDAAFMKDIDLSWTLSLGSRTVNVPNRLFDGKTPFIRLLPSEIFGLLGEPLTARNDRVVTVTAKSGQTSILTAVTFKGQSGGTYTHAIPPSFDPVFQSDDSVRISFDLTGLRDGSGGLADGGELIVTDIDRAVPQAFPNNNASHVDVHGFTRPLPGLNGAISLSAADFPHGVGTYGVALRGTKGGKEIADSTSFFLPLRFAPHKQQIPATPKIQGVASILNGTAPLFYEAIDTEPDGGSTRFAVTFDVSAVKGATGALIEFSGPTVDFAKALFVTGKFTTVNAFVNNFTNPNGDRLDAGDNFGQPGETAHVQLSGTSGVAVLDGKTIGLSIPAGKCDSTYQVRVFGTDGKGNILGVGGNGSVLSYADFMRGGACFT